MKKSNIKYLAVIAVVGGFLSAMGLVGCAASHQVASKPGVQLWSENCGRCHNIRTPSSYGDAQWEIVMAHMRTRANLTSDEADQILEFLQAAN